MAKQKISDNLDSVLGSRVLSVQARTYKVDDFPIESRDLAEVVLRFEENIDRFFSWAYLDDDFELSIQCTSHLLPDAFDDDAPKISQLLSEIIYEPLTAYELFADEFQSVVCVRLTFESRSKVISVGHDFWNENEQKGEFSGFVGDDLFLWSDEEFEQIVRLHRLNKVLSNQYSTV